MEQAKNKKVRVARVVSDKMDKTVVVAISELLRHPLYAKAVKRTKRFKAHDENNSCKVGDKVKVIETRPISKEKHWKVIEILEKAPEKE